MFAIPLSSLTLHQTDHRYDLIEESPASTVSRTWTATAGGREQWIVLKTATVRRKFSKEPHDIIKELRILSSLSHPNVGRMLRIVKDLVNKEY
jgi:serine/threonine protein kinase